MKVDLRPKGDGFCKVSGREDDRKRIFIYNNTERFLRYWSYWSSSIFSEVVFDRVPDLTTLTLPLLSLA